MKYLLVLSLFVLSAYSQPPVPVVSRCDKTPVPQWIGEMHESNHENMDPSEPVIRTAYIFYDATNKRVNITERELLEPGDRNSRITEIYLHNVDPPMRYRVDIVTGRCESERLTEEFRPFGVPANSTFHGIDYLGATSNALGLLVDSFSKDMGGPRPGGHYHGFWAPATSMANSACVPVIETYRNHDAPVPRRTNIHATFRNIKPVTPTAPFPADTFTIPPACRQ